MKILLSMTMLFFTALVSAHYDGLTCHEHDDGWDGWGPNLIELYMKDNVPCYDDGTLVPVCCPHCVDNKNKEHDFDLRDHKYLYLPYKVNKQEFRAVCIELTEDRRYCDEKVEVMMSCG